MKLALLAPEAMVTVAGTVTDPLPLDSATLVLLVAAAERVTVQVDVPGGVSVPGEQLRLDTVGGGAFSASVKVLEVPFKLAVSKAELLVVIAEGALAVKLALLAPEPMVTVAGTVTDALPLDSATLVLLVAAAERVTVQLDLPGGVSVPGEQFRLDSTGGGGG